MDDLKALVDALVILYDDYLAQRVIDNNDVQRCLSELQDMLAADMEPVVRCKDCKHSTLPSALTQRYGVPGTLTCHNRYSPCNRRNVGGEDFCSSGEGKNGGDSDAKSM